MTSLGQFTKFLVGGHSVLCSTFEVCFTMMILLASVENIDLGMALASHNMSMPGIFRKDLNSALNI